MSRTPQACPAAPAGQQVREGGRPGVGLLDGVVATGWHPGPVPADLRAASRDAARRVLGRRGLVRSCDEISWHPGLPRLHIRRGRGPLRMPGWRPVSSLDGTGVSTDPEEARLAAIAETVERYAGMAPVPDEVFVRAAFADLGDEAVRPASFALLSAAQYRRFPQLEALSETKVVDWCRAFSLTHRRPVLVPAALVHASRARRPPNDFVAEATTTGTACHVSLPHAVLAGLREVLERDALTIAWRNRLAHPVVDPTGTAVADLLDGAFAGCEARFTLFDVPTDSPFPVALALAARVGGRPFAAVGAACRADRVAAGCRALLEASQVLSRLVDRDPPRPRRVRTFSDHADLYAGDREASLLRSIIGGGGRLALVDLPLAGGARAEEELLRAVAHLGERGSEVIVAELTTPDVASAGYRVVRVVVPGMVDMNADARCPALGGTRLYQLPVRLGLRGRPASEGELNVLPVPLA